MTIDRLVALLDAPRRTARGWQARCPAHADKSPSLSIQEGRMAESWSIVLQVAHIRTSAEPSGFSPKICFLTRRPNPSAAGSGPVSNTP